MLKMNYSDYEKKTWEQVYKEAIRRGIMPFSSSSNKKREDLIGEIIAHDAYYEGRNDIIRERYESIETNPVKNENENKREPYVLHEEDRDPIYLKLTPAQVNFVKWCIDNQINFRYSDFKEIDNIKYMSP